MRLAILTLAMLAVSNPALALERPVLPANAKQLSGAEIQALYGSSVGEFNNVSNEVTLTGRSWNNFKNNTVMGFYLWDKKDHGVFKATNRMKGDLFCYKPDAEKETCVNVYQDGDKVYETDAKGIVTSYATLSPAAAPSAPVTAPATPEEFTAFADGKTFETVIYDFDVPVVALIKWDVTKKKRVTGTYIANGKDKGKFANPVSFKDGKVCNTQKGQKPACYAVHISGNSFIEVNADGKVHAASKRF